MHLSNGGNSFVINGRRDAWSKQLHYLSGEEKQFPEFPQFFHFSREDLAYLGI
jgi:hypothetical protein